MNVERRVDGTVIEVVAGAVGEVVHDLGRVVLAVQVDGSLIVDERIVGQENVLAAQVAGVGVAVPDIQARLCAAINHVVIDPDVVGGVVRAFRRDTDA